VYATHNHILLASELRRPEAVGYPHVELTVLISTGRDTGHKQLDELAALLKGFFGILLDLAYALSQGPEKPRMVLSVPGSVTILEPFSNSRESLRSPSGDTGRPRSL
jgi:hypothetical protein